MEIKLYSQVKTYTSCGKTTPLIDDKRKYLTGNVVKTIRYDIDLGQINFTIASPRLALKITTTVIQIN